MTDEQVKKILRTEALKVKPDRVVLERALEALPKFAEQKFSRPIPSPYGFARDFNFRQFVTWRLSLVSAVCAIFAFILVGGFYGVPGMSGNSLIAEAESFADSADSPELLLLAAEDAIASEKNLDLFNEYEKELFNN